MRKGSKGNKDCSKPNTFDCMKLVMPRSFKVFLANGEVVSLDEFISCKAKNMRLFVATPLSKGTRQLSSVCGRRQHVLSLIGTRTKTSEDRDIETLYRKTRKKMKNKPLPDGNSIKLMFEIIKNLFRSIKCRIQFPIFQAQTSIKTSKNHSNHLSPIQNIPIPSHSTSILFLPIPPNLMTPYHISTSNPNIIRVVQLQLNQLNLMAQEQRQMQSIFQDDPHRLKYPALNVFFSPRVFQQRIDHKSIPMCAYTRPVQASNISKIFDQQCPDSNDLRELNLKDGLIYQFKTMNKRQPGKTNEPLKIKLLMCVCMYNENKNAIQLTLSGIYDNLKNLEDEGISSQEIAVVLMQDGILKLVSDRNKRTFVGNKKEKNSMVEFYRRLDELDGKPKCELQERVNVILDEIDNYNRKGMGSYVANNRDFPPSIQKNISLLYQNLWNPGMTDPKRAGENFGGKYLKIFTCFKHLNGTKLSSHLWFFEGFCRYLDPQYICLLDVGTKPEDTGVVNLIRGFIDKDVGGVTGLMSVDSEFPSLEGGDEQDDDDSNCLSRCLKDSFFSIEKAQEYEYIIAHFLDKNAEGALGFLHVLPGAWSAYRYKALIKSQEYEPNLLEHSYFKMILNPELQEKDYREANMYLAEDRILSLGIYCQTKEKYYLRYVPDAVAKTDPMKDHQNLMKQRRRWINSSLFAFLYVYKNYYFNAMQSKHSFMDKYIKLNLSMVLALLSFATSYLTPSIYFYVLFATIYQIAPDNLYCKIAAKVVSIFYIMVYLVAVAGGLTGSVWTKHAHVVSAVLSFFTFAMWGLVTYNIIFIYLGFGTTGIDWGSFNQVSILVMTGINLGVYYIVVFMHVPTHCNFVWRLFRDQISYLSYQGAYAQTMVAHAFCNVDDVSWGTKGSTASHGGKKYETQKVFFVSSWLFYNCLLAYIMIYVDVVIPQSGTGPENNRKWILIIIAIYGTSQMFIKSMLAIYYHLKWCFTDCRCLRKPLYSDRKEKVDDFWRASNEAYLREVPQIQY